MSLLLGLDVNASNMKVDVCDRPVPGTALSEAVGAALLAGLAIGLFKDEAQAAAVSEVAEGFPESSSAGQALATFTGAF